MTIIVCADTTAGQLIGYFNSKGEWVSGPIAIAQETGKIVNLIGPLNPKVSEQIEYFLKHGYTNE